MMSFSGLADKSKQQQGNKPAMGKSAILRTQAARGRGRGGPGGMDGGRGRGRGGPGGYGGRGRDFSR